MYNVVKRDGKVVGFDLHKIRDAITKAFDACQKQYNSDTVDFLALKVTADFEQKIKNDKISVESIQDSVESVLIKAGYDDVAKAYILYRSKEKRSEISTQRFLTIRRSLTTISMLTTGELRRIPPLLIP